MPKGSKPIRILHLSDLHLRKTSYFQKNFLPKLNPSNYDFVVVTGDFISSNDGIDIFLNYCSNLTSLPGFYVFGSNDYYKPVFKNPLSYLIRNSSNARRGEELDWKKLDCSLQKCGWINLTHKKQVLDIEGNRIELRGTDDAHLERDSYFAIKGSPEEKCFSILVTHAPYLRLLNSAIKDEIQLVLAGHTHGGQIRLPWFPESKALTTNCDLPTSMSRGLTKLSEKTWLHVSAGLGSSPFTPIRFACPGEVTRITLVSESNDS